MRARISPSANWTASVTSGLTVAYRTTPNASRSPKQPLNSAPPSRRLHGWIKQPRSSVAKKIKACSSRLDDAPAALAKFKSKGEDPKKLNKKEIVAIALKYYGVELAESRKKDDLIAALEKEIASKPTVLASVTAPDGGHTGAISEQDLLSAAGYGSSDGGEDEEMDEEE